MPPTFMPLHPASSISLPADAPSTFLKTHPAVGFETGCLDFFSLINSITLFLISNGSSFLRDKTAPTIMEPAGISAFL